MTSPAFPTADPDVGNDADAGNDAEQRLAGLTVADEQRLRHRRRGAQHGDRLARWEQDLAHAEAHLAQRVAARRNVATAATTPTGLPIDEHRDEFLAALADHQVVIVAGETGSGKSTQLPKLCLAAGRGERGLIGHTQPRRIAARTVAERIASELSQPGGGAGDAVGYAVRFTDTVQPLTLLKVMTDGILLAEIQRDRLLTRYDTLIIDEAHERSLNIDFLLGYLHQLLPRRPDLKVIVTSATIDTDRFAAHFGGAPVVEVSGRGHPVEVRYRPPTDTADQTQAICDAVAELRQEGPGDILVFLSGEREIRDTAEALRDQQRGSADESTEILPLYARLSAGEQQRVFRAHRGRRVVLATNVAETSLTVPGVRYVVDPGTARVSRYNRRTKVQRLPIEAISQASADQRAGRCGRVAPGVCIRLYAEEDYSSRPAFTEPEILRTNLASVILAMAALGLGDIAAFPFLEPPDRRAVNDGIMLLEELGALDASHAGTSRWLTPLGRRLAKLPLDPRLGRMVLAAQDHGCVREVIVIAAALSIQDPRERPVDARQVAAEQHGRFTAPGSDFVSWLNLWEHLRGRQRALSSGQFRRECKAEFLNHLRVREWQDIVTQVRQVCNELDIRSPAADLNHDAVHQALLSGLLSQVGVRDEDGREFIGPRGARFVVARDSALAKRSPRWVMAGELVETNRLWAHTVAGIQPQWIEKAGAHLVRRTLSGPQWDRRRGTAVAIERVTLFGLTVVAGRRVDLGPHDPALARELFLRHALVEGDWTAVHSFVEGNRRATEQVRSLEDRSRRRDLLVDDEALVAFFDERVPAGITTVRRFDRWWKQESPRRPHLLDYPPELLLDPATEAPDAADFPDRWSSSPLTVALRYHFEPGALTDGVTAEVTTALVPRLDEARLDWQVPGRRPELVAALLRSLPKTLRRRLVPVADHVGEFLANTGPTDGALLPCLARYVRAVTGDAVAPDSFAVDQLPDHLRVTYRVVDDGGALLAQGKNPDELSRRLEDRVRAAVAATGSGIERRGMRRWELPGDIPTTVQTTSGGHRLQAYPALVDDGDSVALRLLPTTAEQAVEMWNGTRRLLRLGVASPGRAVERHLGNDARLALLSAGYRSVAEVVEDCIDAALDQVMLRCGGPAWDRAGFSRLEEAARRELPGLASQLGEAMGRVLGSVRRIHGALLATTSPTLQPAVTDMTDQMASLVYPGMVTAVGLDRLTDVGRYLVGIERRLERLAGHGHQDRIHMQRIQALEAEADTVLRVMGTAGGEQAESLVWLLQELRVSFFAQSLGTAGPVSEKRIRSAMAQLRATR